MCESFERNIEQYSKDINNAMILKEYKEDLSKYKEFQIHEEED